jgi:hypothetical protein
MIDEASQFASWMEEHGYKRDIKNLLGVFGVCKLPTAWSIKRLIVLWRRYENGKTGKIEAEKKIGMV